MRVLLLFALFMVSVQTIAATALPVKEVATGVYVHFGKHQFPDSKNHGEIANLGFIVGQKCVAVIDSGGNPEQGLALKQAVTETTQTPICYVINTHVHPDHIYGNSAFKAAGVKFVGHHKLAGAMAARGSYYLGKAAEQLDVKLSAADLITPDIEVKDSLKLDLGGRTLILKAHPTAHTDNDLSVYDEKNQYNMAVGFIVYRACANAGRQFKRLAFGNRQTGKTVFSLCDSGTWRIGDGLAAEYAGAKALFNLAAD